MSKNGAVLFNYTESASLFALVILIIGAGIFGQFPLGFVLLVASLAVSIPAYLRGMELGEITQAAWRGFKRTSVVLWVVGIVGLMIPAWMISGSIPMLVYHGLPLISPQFFILTAFLVAALVSTLLGTCLGTLGTVGIPLMGIGAGLGIPQGWLAGAVISGALVGDRASPLSGTFHLMVSMTESDRDELFKRIWVSGGAALLLAAALYLAVGSLGSVTMEGIRPADGSGAAAGIGAASAGIGAATATAAAAAAESIAADQAAVLQQSVIKIRSAIEGAFVLHPVLLLTPLLTLVLAVKKVDIRYTLLTGTFFGALMAAVVQQVPVLAVFNAMLFGYHPAIQESTLAQAFQAGGFLSMLKLIGFITAAGVFSGILEESGLVGTLIDRSFQDIRRQGSLMLATAGSAMVTALLMCNQALPIIVPARMLKGMYDKLQVSRVVLGRVLADSSLVFAVVVPWNVFSLICSAMLGVAVFEWAPYAFFVWALLGINLLVALAVMLKPFQPNV